MRAIRYAFTIMASLIVGSAVFVSAIMLMMGIASTVRSASDLTPLPGTVAPVIELPDLSGKTVQISDFKGQRTVLVFWADWCPDCKAVIPELNRMRNRGVRVVGINLMEDPDRVAAAVRDDNIRYPVLLDRDGEVGRKFGVQAIPNVFVLDENGVIVHHGYQAPTREQVLRTSREAATD
jgi:peroxiredoxin